MSLEEKIDALVAATQANTEAITALATAWNSLKKQAAHLQAAGTTMADAPEVGQANAEPEVGQANAEPKPETKSKPKAEPKPEVKPEAKAEPEVKAEPKPEAKATPADTEILTAELTQAVGRAAVRNRQGLIDLLKSRGVARATQLPADQWPALIAELGAL